MTCGSFASLKSDTAFARILYAAPKMRESAKRGTAQTGAAKDVPKVDKRLIKFLKSFKIK